MADILPGEIFTNFYTQKGIMGEEEAPREKKHLDVKSNTILTHFEFLRNYAEFLSNIARVLVGLITRSLF